MNRANENNMNKNCTKLINTPNIRWMLVGYDLIVYAVVAVILLVLYGGMDKLSTTGILQQVCLSVLCIFAVRLIGKVYEQVWRYGGIQCYVRLLFTDSIAFVAYLCLELLLPVQKITFARMLSLVSLNLLGALALRMMYRYAYKCGNQETVRGKFLSILLHIFSGIEAGNEKEVQKIKVAIIGAGRVGVSLAEELLNNSEAAYVPRCFIDINKEKVGRDIHGIPVWSETEATFKKLGEFEVQEIIFAIPSMDADKKKTLYERIVYDNTKRFFTFGTYPGLWQRAVKSSLFKKFCFNIDESVAIGEDFAITLPLMLSAETICVIRKPLYFYRVTMDSASRSFNAREMDFFALMLKTIENSGADVNMCGIKNQLGAYTVYVFYNYLCDYIRLTEDYKKYTRFIKNVDDIIFRYIGYCRYNFKDARAAIMITILKKRLWRILWLYVKRKGTK